jgi:Cu2+-exporting ATPase
METVAIDSKKPQTKSSAKLTQATFPVTGMSCAACAVSVESMIGSLPGVAQANVNFASQSVQVGFDSAVVQPADFKVAVQSVGYDLLVEETSVEDLEALQEEKYKKLVRHTWWASVLAIPVAIIGMFFHHSLPYANEIMFALTAVVVFGFGRRFFVNAIKQAGHLWANMDTLVALSTGIAFFFSAFNTFFPKIIIRQGLVPHVYFEAAAVIIVFILLGKLLEERAKVRTSSAIKNLIGLQPKTVKVIRNGNEEEMPIGEVLVNDQILIRPGEKIPVDGSVLNGNSFVDESMISGEPMAVEKKTGDTLFAGTINQQGSFRMIAEKVGSQTLLAQIIRTVQQAQGSKAPVQKLVDKIAGIFVPVVIGIALLSFAVWCLVGGDNGFSHGLLALVTVLIIACPCALGLATPTAIMVGVGKGAENGMLIKDAESLETVHKIDAIILDKTGTITLGQPSVTDIQWAPETIDPTRLEQIIFSIEEQSEHPLAEAVTRHLAAKGLISVATEQFDSITGKGIKAVIEGQAYWVGNEKLMHDNQIQIPVTLSTSANQWKVEAKTVIYFADASTVLGILAITDPVKETSAKAVQDLQKLGIDVYMLTGDTTQTAQQVANKVGIATFKAEMLPGDKAAFVQQLQTEGKIVAMVGDGINDSQALALADASIAMGKGSDIALDVASITLIKSDLQHIVKAIRLSKATVRTIRQNLFWAFIYNIFGIPVAAGLLYPINDYLLDPMIAGAAMALSSVSVVTNSLRLRATSI